MTIPWCRVDYYTFHKRILLQQMKIRVKASSHIDDTTRHNSMRHDMIFRFPYNQMDQFTHMQHDQAWSSRQKAPATGSDFCHLSQRQYQKTAKENSFNRNLTLVYTFMTQEEPFEVTIPSV